MKKKVLTVIQDISRAQEHEWLISYLDRAKIDMHFALINSRNTPMEKFIVEHGLTHKHFTYSSKKDLPGLIFNLTMLMRREKYDAVHTHLFEASLTGLTAAFLSGIRNRIYTRHHSDYHHVWFPKAIKYDRFINRAANKIVATSNNVKDILVRLEGVPEGKITVIRHGIDMLQYETGAVSEERIETIRKKYDLNNKRIIVGAISRFTEWKGLQYTIPAFRKLLEKYPDAVLVLANALGNYKAEIGKLLEELPKSSYRTIVFENDIAALYRVFNCFIHVPINPTAEAFGQTYLESLASRIPSVFTLSGVAPEFIKHKEHALLVPFKDSEAVLNSIIEILENPAKALEMAERGCKIVSDLFDVRKKVADLEQLYLDKK